jgi:UDP-N-acetylmuramoyl-L-alanyl-D-glutamate--2,6-diaminopimelate ligase
MSRGPAWVSALADEKVEVIGKLPASLTAVCYDSRRVEPGSLFVAVPGATARSRDGHEFIEQALERSAAALVVQAGHRAAWGRLAEGGPPWRTPLLVVEDTRRALALLAAAFHGWPARRLRVVGVTGTDGKTTTAHLIAAVLEAGGHPCALLSSAELRCGGRATVNATHMTTLEAPEVQAFLAGALKAGDQWAVVEASSHGLALHRVDACEFDVAVFTTLGSDHLDFHGTMEEYKTAKGRLFQMLDEAVDKGVPKTAVLNADEPASDYFRRLTAARVVTYGLAAPADVTACQVHAEGSGTSFGLTGAFGATAVKTQLVGRYNVYNCLAAAAVGLSMGLSVEEVKTGLEGVSGVPGRMELIDAGQPFAVVVDFASTPQALANTLGVLRAACLPAGQAGRGRLWAVFGCAGERDPGRRDGMGRAAGRLADFVVVTNEDPRSEDPDAIIEAITVGLREAGRNEGTDFVRIPNRRQAIAYAFERASDNDVVLLAGKGSEQTMVFGDKHVPWDERVVARELLEETRQTWTKNE